MSLCHRALPGVPSPQEGRVTRTAQWGSNSPQASFVEAVLFENQDFPP